MSTSSRPAVNDPFRSVGCSLMRGSSSWAIVSAVPHAEFRPMILVCDCTGGFVRFAIMLVQITEISTVFWDQDEALCLQHSHYALIICVL